MKAVRFVALILILIVASGFIPKKKHDVHSGMQQAAVSVSFEKLKGKSSRSYIFAVVKRDDNEPPASESNQKLANLLLDRANNWAIDQYEVREPALTDYFETMRAKPIDLTNRSSYVIVFDENDLSKPAATLWRSYPDGDGKVDLERWLNWKYPRPQVALSNYPMVSMKNGMMDGIAQPYRLQGGIVELKRLVVDPKSPRELMPAMILQGEGQDHLNTQPITVDGQDVLPSEYVLHCGPLLVPVYKHYGFSLVQPEPVRGDFVMKIERFGYVENTVKAFEKARMNGWNLKLVKSVKWDSVNFEKNIWSQFSKPRSCKSLLGS